MLIGGEHVTFWVALILTAAVKWLFSAKATARQSVGGVVAGVLIAYFGHDFVIRNVGLFQPEDDIVVSIVLVLTGEHLTRALIAVTPEKAWKLWKGKG